MAALTGKVYFIQMCQIAFFLYERQGQVDCEQTSDLLQKKSDFSDDY